MIFLVIENFSEAVDPAQRRKRLAKILRRARVGVHAANVHGSLARHHKNYAGRGGSSYDAGVHAYVAARNVKYARKASDIYAKHRMKHGKGNVGFKSSPGEQGPVVKIARARLVGYSGDKSAKKKIGKN